MNQLIQTTAIIRERGQLTIPDKIRRALTWLAPHSVVKFFLRGNEIILKQYQSSATHTVNWKRIWEKIQLARSFKGKRGNLSQFILEDRKRH